MMSQKTFQLSSYQRVQYRITQFSIIIIGLCCFTGICNATVLQLPENIEDLTIQERKIQFQDVLSKAIDIVNLEILKEQDFLHQYLEQQKIPSESLQNEYQKLCKKYKTSENTELQKRIHPIPKALALAQAAIESGWGTSRTAKEAKNLYGTQNFSGNGLRPREIPKDSKRRLVIYPSIVESIRDYARNLNTNVAYTDFRELRSQDAALKTQIFSLLNYAEIGEEYPKLIWVVLTQNFLDLCENC